MLNHNCFLYICTWHEIKMVQPNTRILMLSPEYSNKSRMYKMNCELMLTYDTPAYMFNVYKNQPSRQTGSRNVTGPKTLPTIWGTYMKLVTKYQIPAIWEKCDEKYLGTDGRTDGRMDRGKTVYPPPVDSSYSCWILQSVCVINSLTWQQTFFLIYCKMATEATLHSWLHFPFSFFSFFFYRGLFPFTKATIIKIVWKRKFIIKQHLQ